MNCLDETNLVGNVQSINISGQTDESLLVTIRSDESVNLSGFNIIETLDGILDLVLVGLNINKEGQGVVFLNLLHGSFGVKRLTDNTVLIHTRSMSNRLASVLGSTVQNQSLGDVEELEEKFI